MPEKNAVSQAIYEKYQNQHLKAVDSVIREVDEEEEVDKAPKMMKFKIKNLDTGEEIEIENEEMEQELDKKLSQGLDSNSSSS